MRAHIDVQDRAMQVPQCQPHLHVLPMYGAVCQRHARDPTRQATGDAGNTHRGAGDRKGKEASQAHKGRGKLKYQAETTPLPLLE